VGIIRFDETTTIVKPDLAMLRLGCSFYSDNPSSGWGKTGTSKPALVIKQEGMLPELLRRLGPFRQISRTTLLRSSLGNSSNLPLSMISYNLGKSQIIGLPYQKPKPHSEIRRLARWSLLFVRAVVQCSTAATSCIAHVDLS